MIERTAAHFGKEVREVSAYKRYREKLPCPLIICSLEGAPDSRPDEIGTGQLLTDLEFVAYIVVNGLDDDAAFKVRQLAIRLKWFLFRNNFDMGIMWPKIGDAHDAEFDWPKSLANANEFEIWKLDFSYSDVLLGPNSWEGK